MKFQIPQWTNSYADNRYGPQGFFLPKDLLQTWNKGILSGEVFLYCQPWAKAKSVVETRSEVDPEICLFTSNWQSWRHVNIHLTSWGSSSTCRAWKIKIKINKIKMTIADQWSLTSDHRAEPKVTKWSQCVSMCLAKNQHLVTIDFQHSVNEWPPSIEQVITCGPKVVNEWSKGSTNSATKWSLHSPRLPTKLSHSEHLVKWPPRSHQGA